jgi:putative transposase
VLVVGREFTQYRRNLPHFRLEDSTYFVIWRAHPSFAPLPDFAREIAFNAVLHFNTVRYNLLACVVMDDHVHIVLTPQPECPLSKLVQNWKSYSAHEVNKRLSRQGPVWLDESYNRIIRDERELNETMAYIFNNPLERWPELKNYPFLWVKGLETKCTGETPVPPG